jgi:hypothetical protein
MNDVDSPFTKNMDGKKDFPFTGKSSRINEFLNDERIEKMRQQHTTSVHIAILVLRGKIIAQATNRLGSRSKGSGYSNCPIHAEKTVLKEMGDFSKMRNADMVVMRFCSVSRGGSRGASGCSSNSWANSKPCADCEYFLLKCMNKYGLKNVYYTV